ncbi:RES domain [[Clostridium] sordellii]|uniref:RES family NAD+ phosphorylase n=1 Tax=Paraclostridium sordellii TaxID=1505 RepID=UPI0005430F47|nr:RES family NAD+ phosphorylase [Paeniclostridium sordellii]CEK29386.1 RES domain [[Clostridium] sordellii] [Paeniclostridium sordellii]
MKFCKNCVNDIYIKAILEKNKEGTCDICKRSKVPIYDTDSDIELINEFETLLDIYTCRENLPKDFPPEKTRLLADELHNRWNIFNVDSSEVVFKIITSICKEKYTSNPNFFENSIGIKDYNQKEKYLVDDWNEFCRSIKLINRFHYNNINLNMLKKFLEYTCSHIEKGRKFYRARICEEDSEKFEKKQMGAPPKGKAKSGRINPLGISHLYLSNEKDTTTYEVKAKNGDYVTIGKFKLNRDITVIDMRKLDKISPFSEIDCTEYAINRGILKKIAEEISKPIKDIDADLEYLPIQYITEYIKNENFQNDKKIDGIIYDSTVKKDSSYNLVLFDEKLCDCYETSLYKIDLTYKLKSI